MLVRSIFCCLFVLTSLQFAEAQTNDAKKESSSQNQLAQELRTEYGPFRGKREPHPDFVLPSIEDNKPIRLSDYRGKKVLLLHFASW